MSIRQIGHMRQGWRRVWECVLTWALLAALPMAVQGRVIHVPQDYTEIRDAVDYAYDGDEIVVATGQYKSFTIINNIMVRSTFNGDWSVIRKTIIEGGVYFSDNYKKQDEKCIVRGFTIHTGTIGVESGIINGKCTHATIEYNIISGQNNEIDTVPGYMGGGGKGAGIVNCDGLIQNNMIENNRSNRGAALYNCNGTIQNNIIRNNRVSAVLGSTPPGIHPFRYYVSEGFGGAIANCNGLIRNNTLVDNQQRVIELTDDNYDLANVYWTAGGLYQCKGTIVNNIIYNTTMTMPVELDGCTSPTHCLFHTPRPGEGNITGDPGFVNVTSGDYHLRPDSPCINHGQSFTDLPIDFDGLRRGGGAGYDIGAFETRPAPVAVWLPAGLPRVLVNGDALPISWSLAAPADTAVRLRLYYAGGRFFYDLGRYSSLTADAVPITIPKYLDTRSDYMIQAISIANGSGVSYTAETPPFTILGTRKNAVPARAWEHY